MPLPRQSLLGTFWYPHCQPSDIWPILYLCPECGHSSVHLAEEIHPLGVEVQVQSLAAYRLVCYEYVRENDKTKTLLFSKIAPTLRTEEAFGESVRIAGQMEEKPRLLRHFVID